jgi:hypothetical protein
LSLFAVRKSLKWPPFIDRNSSAAILVIVRPRRLSETVDMQRLDLLNRLLNFEDTQFCHPERPTISGLRSIAKLLG